MPVNVPELIKKYERMKKDHDFWSFLWQEIADVNEWLEDCAKRMFRAFNQSNFAQEIHEVYLDEVAFGTSAVFLEERKPEKADFHGFIFRCLPLNTFVLDEDQEGRVNTVIRKFCMSAAAAIAQWGKENLGEKVLKAIEDGKSETMFDFLHAIYPRLTGTAPDPKLGTPKTKLPWASVYIGIE